MRKEQSTSFDPDNTLADRQSAFRRWAFRYVESHHAACNAASAEVEHHADDATIRDRIGTMGTEQLAVMLGPAAWIGVTAHELMSS